MPNCRLGKLYSWPEVIFVSDIILKCYPTYLDKHNERKVVTEAVINRKLSEKLKPSTN